MNSKLCLSLVLLFPALFSIGGEGAAEEKGFLPLFSQEGIPSQWVVRRWDDIAKPAEPAAIWKNQNGVLQGSEPRGTWLMSQKEYGDFVLEFEWKLGERGNSGTALRAPLHGD